MEDPAIILSPSDTVAKFSVCVCVRAPGVCSPLRTSPHATRRSRVGSGRRRLRLRLPRRRASDPCNCNVQFANSDGLRPYWGRAARESDAVCHPHPHPLWLPLALAVGCRCASCRLLLLWPLLHSLAQTHRGTTQNAAQSAARLLRDNQPAGGLSRDGTEPSTPTPRRTTPDRTGPDRVSSSFLFPCHADADRRVFN